MTAGGRAGAARLVAAFTTTFFDAHDPEDARGKLVKALLHAVPCELVVLDEPLPTLLAAVEERFRKRESGEEPKPGRRVETPDSIAALQAKVRDNFGAMMDKQRSLVEWAAAKGLPARQASRAEAAELFATVP